MIGKKGPQFFQGDVRLVVNRFENDDGVRLNPVRIPVSAHRLGFGVALFALQ